MVIKNYESRDDTDEENKNQIHQTVGEESNRPKSFVFEYSESYHIEEDTVLEEQKVQS